MFLMHKPLSNRLLEGKKIIEMARNSKVITHLIPWDSNGSMETVMAWINGGASEHLRKCITGQTDPYGRNMRTYPLIRRPFQTALTGIFGWDRSPASISSQLHAYGISRMV
jgi:hypothetical protein